MKQLQAKLEHYKTLLRQYHNALDLMSQAAIDALDTKIADSLEYAECVKSAIQTPVTIADVGAGAGLPGITTALALPHCEVHLVERRTKRTTFLKIVKSKLELSNLHIHALDVADLKGVKADVITALAFSSLADLYCLTRSLHKQNVSVISRKGPDWQSEVGKLRNSVIGLKNIESSSTPLSNDGTLVALRLPGGLTCRSLA